AIALKNRHRDEEQDAGALPPDAGVGVGLAGEGRADLAAIGDAGPGVAGAERAPDALADDAGAARPERGRRRLGPLGRAALVRVDDDRARFVEDADAGARLARGGDEQIFVLAV